MKLSIQGKDLAEFKQISIDDNKELESVITNNTYSLGTFKDNKRNVQSFISADAVGLDFDGGLSIFEAKSIFKEYKHLIATTRNHNKVKNGVKDERFRVILFLSEPITSSAIYKNTIKELLKTYPQADAACTDASRMFYKSSKVFSRKGEGKLVNPASHIKIVDKQQQLVVVPTEIESDMKLYKRLGGKTKQFLRDGAPNGEWHSKLILATFEIRRQHGTEDQAKRLVKGINGYLTNEDEFHINDVYENRDIELAPEEPPKKKGLKIQKVDEFYKEVIKMDWLVDGLLMVGGISLFAGDPKAGKSTLIRQLVKTMDKGGYYLGRKVLAGRVLYLALEEHGGLLQKQMKQVGIDANSNTYVHHGLFDSQDRYGELEEAIVELEPALVVVDTMLDLFRLTSINDYGEVKNEFTKYREISRRTGAHIIVVHHTNKGDALGANKILGSQALSGATDANIIFDRRGNERFITCDVRGGVPLFKAKLVFTEENQTYNMSLGGDYEQF